MLNFSYSHLIIIFKDLKGEFPIIQLLYLYIYLSMCVYVWGKA